MAEIEYVSKEVFTTTMQRFSDEDARQNHRISQLEVGLMKIADMTTSIEKLAVNVEYIATETKENTTRLTNLEGKGGKIWEKIVLSIIASVIGGLVGYLFFRLGLSS